MDEHDDDPFRGLEAWAKDVERRATRAHRLQQVQAAPMRRTRRSSRTRINRATLWLGGVGVALLLLAAVVPTLLSKLSSDDSPDVRHPTRSVPDNNSATPSASATPAGPAAYPRGETGSVGASSWGDLSLGGVAIQGLRFWVTCS